MLSRKFVRKRNPAVGWAVPTKSLHPQWWARPILRSFAVCLAATPTDLVSVEEMTVHYATVMVELNPTELVSVES